MSPRGWRAMARGAQRARAALNRPMLPDVEAVSLGVDRATGQETLIPGLRHAPIVCDVSADVGSVHVWRDGATLGEFCLCGKRKKFLVSDSR